VFKVRLLKKVLSVGLLCVLFKNEFAKVVKIAKNVIRLFYVLFEREAAFVQLVKKSVEDALRLVCVLFEGMFVKIAKNIAFC
jgi:hypothetical protein